MENYIEQIKNLTEQIEMLTYERDFYRQKFEAQQVKQFLDCFTPQEQMDLLQMIDNNEGVE